MEKIYRTISVANITTTIKVNNKEMVVEFLGGQIFPEFKWGKYATTCKNIQEGLENSSGYGKEYTIDKIVSNIVKKQPNAKIIAKVKNKQMAIEWINHNLKKDFSPEDSDNIIREYLQLKGYVMINWK